MKQKLFKDSGLGLGLRSRHYNDVLDANRERKSKWFEALSENYMDEGGRPRHMLRQVRADHPIHLHGVSLSIAGTDPLDRAYLNKLKNLANEVEPAIVSDHCCWTTHDGQNLHDLMPVPFTEEVVAHIAERVLAVQDILGRRILLENVSSYITFRESEMTEWEFLNELSRRADCGLLLDVNNIYVSSVNHGFNPQDFIKGIPFERVGQLHLAGHVSQTQADGTKVLIDTHDQPVCDEVWDLYRETLKLSGPVSTMIEWDAQIPDYDVLESEMMKASAIREEFLGR